MFKLLVAFVQTNKLGCKDVTCLTVSTGTQGVLRPAEDQLLNDASAERHMTLLSVKTKLTFFFFVQIVFWLNQSFKICVFQFSYKQGRQTDISFLRLSLAKCNLVLMLAGQHANINSDNIRIQPESWMVLKMCKHLFGWTFVPADRQLLLVSSHKFFSHSQLTHYFL